MPMGEGTGSTSGLRFNPRYSAEELEEDSNTGREDSEERAKHNAKKQEKQEKRARLLQGIQHLQIKIPQQNKEDEERPTEEAGELAGQVGQADAIDGANPRANGQGMGVMTGEPMDLAFDVIKKKSKDEPKYDRDKPQPTTTIDTVRARQRAERGRKRSKGKKTLETVKNKRRKREGKPLRTGSKRNTKGVTRQRAGTQAGLLSPAYSRMSPIYSRYVSQFTGRGQRYARPAIAFANPRAKAAQRQRDETREQQPTQDLAPPIPTITTESRVPHARRGSPEHRDALLGPKKIHTPRKPKTPMGAEHSQATDLAMGGSSPLGDSAVLASLEFIKKGPIGDYLRARASRPRMTHADKIEYRRLVAKLEKLLRGLRKADASLDPAPDGPTPNAHRRMTSSPTGATESDPDDDPTMWGAHAYGLYVRRGGMT